MRLRRALCVCAAALAFGFGPAAAQTASDASLDAATHAYFDALFKASSAGLAMTTAPSFHVVTTSGKRVSYDEYFKQIFLQNTLEIPPIGNTVTIKSQNVNGSGATETVMTQHWYGGAKAADPMMGPVMERDFATHQLTWVKSPSGTWLLDEDHITAATSI